MTAAGDDDLAGQLIAAWRGGTALSAEQARALAPASDEAAYAVQQQVGAALGWFPAGRARAWKVAASPPAAAPVPDAFVLHSPAHLEPAQTHTVIGVEVELVLRLAHDLLPGCSQQEAGAAIGGLIAGIERFDVRAHDWPHLPARFLLADHQMHGGLILGSGIDAPWQDDFALCEVELLANGQHLHRARGGHALGNPVATLPWLAAHAARHGDGLRAGDLIASGTWTGLYIAQPGQRLTAHFEGIGSVALSIGTKAD